MIQPCGMKRLSFNGWLNWLKLNKGRKNEVVKSGNEYFIIQTKCDSSTDEYRTNTHFNKLKR